MLSALVVVLILSTSQDARDCADVTSCRAAALEAAARSDYETFHDLAWRAAQKGRSNDPELMKMLARAQSLSGRPGDALVMLRRLAQMGVATDAATHDDFRRVRALPGWPELDALFKDDAKRTAEAPDAPVTSATPAGASARTSNPAPKESGAAKPSVDDEPLPPTLASLQPAGLVYDAVSRRFIIGNRAENNLIIYDDVFKRATSMVSAQSAGFYGLTAMALDPHRGDLWIANSDAVRGATVHKLQLISGRVLYEVPFPAELGPVALVDAAVRNDGQLLVLDAQGRRILAVSSHRTVERIMSLDVEGPASLALNTDKTALVAHRGGLLRVDLANRTAAVIRGAPSGLLRIRTGDSAVVAVQAQEGGLRLLRLRLDPAAGKIVRSEVLDSAAALPDPSGITVANGSVYYVTVSGGAAVIRRVRAAK